MPLFLTAKDEEPQHFSQGDNGEQFSGSTSCTLARTIFSHKIGHVVQNRIMQKMCAILLILQIAPNQGGCCFTEARYGLLILSSTVSQFFCACFV